jgi:hypothetical protein
MRASLVTVAECFVVALFVLVAALVAAAAAVTPFELS